MVAKSFNSASLVNKKIADLYMVRKGKRINRLVQIKGILSIFLLILMKTIKSTGTSTYKDCCGNKCTHLTSYRIVQPENVDQKSYEDTKNTYTLVKNLSSMDESKHPAKTSPILIGKGDLFSVTSTTDLMIYSYTESSKNSSIMHEEDPTQAENTILVLSYWMVSNQNILRDALDQKEKYIKNPKLIENIIPVIDYMMNTFIQIICTKYINCRNTFTNSFDRMQCFVSFLRKNRISQSSLEKVNLETLFIYEILEKIKACGFEQNIRDLYYILTKEIPTIENEFNGSKALTKMVHETVSKIEEKYKEDNKKIFKLIKEKETYEGEVWSNFIEYIDGETQSFIRLMCDGEFDSYIYIKKTELNEGIQKLTGFVKERKILSRIAQSVKVDEDGFICWADIEEGKRKAIKKWLKNLEKRKKIKRSPKNLKKRKGIKKELKNLEINKGIKKELKDREINKGIKKRLEELEKKKKIEQLDIVVGKVQESLNSELDEIKLKEDIFPWNVDLIDILLRRLRCLDSNQSLEEKKKEIIKLNQEITGRVKHRRTQIYNEYKLGLCYWNVYEKQIKNNKIFRTILENAELDIIQIADTLNWQKIVDSDTLENIIDIISCILVDSDNFTKSLRTNSIEAEKEEERSKKLIEKKKYINSKLKDIKKCFFSHDSLEETVKIIEKHKLDIIEDLACAQIELKNLDLTMKKVVEKIGKVISILLGIVVKKNLDCFDDHGIRKANDLLSEAKKKLQESTPEKIAQIICELAANDNMHQLSICMDFWHNGRRNIDISPVCDSIKESLGKRTIDNWFLDRIRKEETDEIWIILEMGYFIARYFPYLDSYNEIWTRPALLIIKPINDISQQEERKAILIFKSDQTNMLCKKEIVCSNENLEAFKDAETSEELENINGQVLDQVFVGVRRP